MGIPFRTNVQSLENYEVRGKILAPVGEVTDLEQRISKLGIKAAWYALENCWMIPGKGLGCKSSKYKALKKLIRDELARGTIVDYDLDLETDIYYLYIAH